MALQIHDSSHICECAAALSCPAGANTLHSTSSRESGGAGEAETVQLSRHCATAEHATPQAGPSVLRFADRSTTGTRPAKGPGGLQFWQSSTHLIIESCLLAQGRYCVQKMAQ